MDLIKIEDQYDRINILLGRYIRYFIKYGEEKKLKNLAIDLGQARQYARTYINDEAYEGREHLIKEASKLITEREILHG